MTEFFGHCGHKEAEGIFLIGSNTVLGESQPWQWPATLPMKTVCIRQAEGDISIRIVELDKSISEHSYRGNYEVTWANSPSCEGCPYWEKEKERVLKTSVRTGPANN